jgi:hypothetical protein
MAGGYSGGNYCIMTNKLITTGKHPHIVPFCEEIKEVIKKNEAKNFAQKRTKVKIRKIVRVLKHTLHTGKRVIRHYPAPTTL